MTQVIYTIQPGDTLYGIARLFGSTIQAIVQANNITNMNIIYPGTIILIPVAEEYLETPPGSIIYTVQPGDTLYIISLLFKVDIQNILSLNNIANPSLIYPGMKIILPKEAINPFTPIEPGLIKYSVLPGDTIYKIAERFGTSVQSILNANPGLDPKVLLPKMVINITIPENAVAIYDGNSSNKMIALTFDATYGGNQTREILKILKDNNIKSTFFLSGIWLINNLDLAKEIAKEGHEIGNHSLTHPHMPLISMQEIINQVLRTEALIKNITGQDSYLFRQPYGEYNQAILNLIASLGYVSILWSIDSLDWKNPGVDAVLKRVVDNAKPGSIVLMHESALDTPKALQTMINQLKEKGYSFGTVTQVIDQQ